MGSAPPEGTTGLTYADLRALPGDGAKRFELIDGELLVTPAPTTRHQECVARLTAALLTHARPDGWRVLPGPVDVWFAEVTVLEPDVVAVGPDSLARVEPARVVGPPDLVVEVSSPSTRRADLVRKRRVYEEQRVPEFWFVDLDADQVHVYRLEPSGSYGPPEVVLDDGEVTCASVPGFTIRAAEALASDVG